MKRLSVSVVLATFNGERFVAEQLRSLALQYRLPHELVAVDDASSDGTLSILRSFSKESPFPVRIIEFPTRRGSTAAFEQGIRFSEGDVIALCDQDDWWYREKIEELAAVLERQRGVSLAFSDAIMVDEARVPVGATLWERFGIGKETLAHLRVRPFELLMQGPLVTGMTMAVRREALVNVCPIPASWHHDAWIAMLVSLESGFEYVASPLAEYRLHEGQQTYHGSSLKLCFTRGTVKSQRFADGSARWLALVERVREGRIGRDADRVCQRMERRAEYLAARSLAYGRGTRFRGVWRAHQMGGYEEFGKGSQTALVDLLHVARPHVVAY